MKKTITLLTMFAIFCLSNISNAQITSIANGDWTNPLTWGGAPPMPGSVVIINHAVTLDIDYGYSTGSITINSTGVLTSTVPMRGISISGGSFTNSGTFSIPRVALFGGNIINNGTFNNDSLFINTSLTDNSGATINANQFMVSTSGTFVNSGTVVATNFLNLSSVINIGAITANDLLNSKSFTNDATGSILVNHNFLNTDSIVSPGIFTNNGTVRVNHDWRNTAQINGSGKFCIQDNTMNQGTMSGTFDFCDLTGGNIDFGNGSIAGTITYCLYSCSNSVNNNSETSNIDVYPNPSNGIFTFNLNSENLEVEIYDIIGSRIYHSNMSTQKSEIDLSNQAKGVYFYKIKNQIALLKTGKIVID